MATPMDRDGAVLKEVRKAVRNMRRRYVLYYLDHNDGVATIDELVDRISAWENGSASDEVSGRKRESVYSSLYQTHVPKLEQIGVVRYDATDKTVSMTEIGERVSLRCAANGAPDTRYVGSIVGLNSLVLVLIVLRQWEVIQKSAFLELSGTLVVGLSVVALWQFHVIRAWKRRYRRRGPDYILDIDEEGSE